MGIEVCESCGRGRVGQLNEGCQLNESSIHRNPPAGYPFPHNLGARPRNDMDNKHRNSPSRPEIEMTNMRRNSSIRRETEMPNILIKWPILPELETEMPNILKNRPILPELETEMPNILKNRPILPEYDESYRPRNPPTGSPTPKCFDDLWGNKMSNSLRNSPTRPGNKMSFNRRSSSIRPGNELSYSLRNSPILPAGSPILHPWPPIESVTDHQNVTRTQSTVNLRRSTLRFEEDEENPGYHLLAFTFDAAIPGSICIFYMARECLNSSILPLRSYLLPPLQIAFNRGFGQNFRQAPGTGVDLSLLEDLGVVDNGNLPDRDFPLIIRLDTEQNGWPGAPLPRDVPCHITQADIKKTGGQYRVSVLQQFVWVEGVRYEVNQIHGIGTSSGGDESKELCVICLYRPRVILAWPCRHISMCERCVQLLWRQSNRCPLCKTPMERLLKIEEVGVGYIGEHNPIR